jgi:hypothetical protein
MARAQSADVCAGTPAVRRPSTAYADADAERGVHVSETAPRCSIVRRAMPLALSTVLLVATVGAPDSLKIDLAGPPKSFRFSHGADPVQIEITVRSDVESPNGREIALAVHDQSDRPLMTTPMPIAHVKRGRDSVIFRPMVRSLGADVTRVIVETVFMRTPGAGLPRPGETWQNKLTYKVE